MVKIIKNKFVFKDVKNTIVFNIKPFQLSFSFLIKMLNNPQATLLHRTVRMLSIITTL